MMAGINNVAITVLSQKYHRIINAVFEGYFQLLVAWLQLNGGRPENNCSLVRIF